MLVAIDMVPEFVIPPPTLLNAMLPLKVELASESVPEFLIPPPPFAPLDLVAKRSETDAVASSVSA